MKVAVFLDYKPTRYEGKGFLRNLNIRIHRDITGEMWFGVGIRLSNQLITEEITLHFFIINFVSSTKVMCYEKRREKYFI